MIAIDLSKQQALDVDQNAIQQILFYQIFLPPQVTQWAIITYKHGIYELPHELPNDLRLRILGN